MFVFIYYFQSLTDTKLHFRQTDLDPKLQIHRKKQKELQGNQGNKLLSI